MYFNIFFNSYHSGQSTSARNNPPTTKVTPKCLHCKKPLHTQKEMEQHKKVCPPKKKKTCKFDNVKFSNIRFNFLSYIPFTITAQKPNQPEEDGNDVFHYNCVFCRKTLTDMKSVVTHTCKEKEEYEKSKKN